MKFQRTVEVMLFLGAIAMAPGIAAAQTSHTSSLEIDAATPGPVINRDIFGQFVEFLGEGIYGGIWVGPRSPIPNVRGIRSDVVNALRALKVPVVRWPGGCYADTYSWRDGIGPAGSRVARVNGNWGGVLEPNTFGTHEFMDFVEQIGSEAYININLATGTPREAAQWLEYMTTDKPTQLGQERIANGRKEPWRIKYMGVGNESWGCGGNMSAQTYVEQLKLYTTFVKNLNPAQGRTNTYVPGPDEMMRIAVGPEDEKPEYTEAVMKAWQDSRPWRWGFEGLSLHHYVMGRTPLSSPATGFNEADYAVFVKQTREMDDLIGRHSAIMDKYDPHKKVALVVDEWGVWLAPMAGTNPRFLKQQNSLRDALLASLNLNIFARHADRVRMANIAQMANVLQSMILTDAKGIILTPTYHVFRMYLPFQDARLLPVALKTGTYRNGDVAVPQTDAIAGRAKDGTVWLAVTNFDPANPADIELNVGGIRASSAKGEVLSADAIDAINTGERPDRVVPRPFAVKARNGHLDLRLAAASLAVVRLDP